MKVVARRPPLPVAHPHVIARYVHRAQHVTCRCGWAGSSAAAVGERSEWQRHVAGLETGEVIGHLDLFWTNVVFRDGRPVALVDWDLAAPATRALEGALAATYWAPLRIDEQAVEWGLQLDRRGERLRLLCDAYGLDAAARATLLDELTEQRRGRLARWAEWHPAGTHELIVANLRWLEAHRSDLARFLA